jgi:peptidyl-prolyl cis-trans isomerase SurA
VRKQIRQDLLRQKVQQMYAAPSAPNRSDVEAFFSEYHDSLPPIGPSIKLSVLKVKTAASDSVRQNAWAKIKAVKDRLDRGENFTTVARQFSEDPNAAEGGEIGFVKKGSLTELSFEERLFSLRIGEVSDIFETRLGFHIVKCLEKKDQTVRAAQIFVAVQPPEEQVRKTVAELQSVASTVKSREDFIAAVRKLSTDEVTRSLDGGMGWQEVAALPPEIASAVASLSVGDISEPLLSGAVIAVYRVDEKVDSRPLTLADDWNEIAALAQRVLSQKKLSDLVKKWRDTMYVNVRL